MQLSTILLVGLSTVLYFGSLANALIDYPATGVGGYYDRERPDPWSHKDPTTPYENAQKSIVRGNAAGGWIRNDQMSTFNNIATPSLVFFGAEFPALHIILRGVDDRNNRRSTYLDLGSNDRQNGQFKSSWIIFRGPVEPLAEYAFRTMDEAEVAFGQLTAPTRLANIEHEMLTNMANSPFLHTHLNYLGHFGDHNADSRIRSPQVYRTSQFPRPTSYNHIDLNNRDLVRQKASILIIGSYARGEIDPTSGRIKEMKTVKLNFH